MAQRDIENATNISGTTLRDRGHHVFKTGCFSDQVLRVTNRGPDNQLICREIHVHSVVLSLASPVFERMIFGPMNNKDYLEIHEENIELFHTMLEYIYVRDLHSIAHWQMADIIDLMQMAHRYMVNDLVELCGIILIPTRICNTSFTVLNLAIHFNAPGLIEECTKLIRDRTQEFFQHEGFTSLSADALVHILKQDVLNVESELKVFEAAVRWADTYISHSSFSDSLILQDQNYPHTSSPATKITKPSLEQIVLGNVSNINNQNTSTEMDVVPVCDSGLGMDSNMTDATQSFANVASVGSTVHENNNEMQDCTNMECGKMDETEFNDDKKEYEKKLREVLQESGALRHIRFLSLSPSDFVSGVGKKNILTSEEIAHVLLTLNIAQYASTIDPSALVTYRSSSTSHPKEICQITKPRINKSSIPDRVDGIVNFHFNHLRWIECHAYTEFEEIFECHSTNPIVIDSVVMPPKQKKKPSMGANYEEEFIVTLYTVDEKDEHINRIAGGNFKNRRRYGENKEYKLSYNMSDKEIFLQNGMKFAATMCFVKDGSYLGGFELRDDCKQNNIIRVPENKCRGIIQGFKFSFIKQQP